MNDVLLLSRSDDKTLLNFSSQEEYFEIILKSEKDSKLLKIRKLREGILASKRRDLFALKVYETSVDECLACRNFNELLLSLMGLMKLYLLFPATAKSRVDEIASYYLLFFTSKSTKDVGFLLKGLDSSILTGDRVSFALRWIKAISNLNYYELSALRSCATLNEKIILESSLPSLRARIVEMLTKSYFTIPSEVLLFNLMLMNDKASRSVLEALIPFPINANGIVELKRRR